jgi:CRISPR/Cas system-associated protein Csm6
MKDIKKSIENELIEKIIRRIDNCVISPFEGAFLEGKEISREKVMDLIRTAFNRCCNQLREELDTFKQAEKIE